MKAVLLGATRGMGRALARLLAERGDALFLLGRNPDDVERSCRDLEVRGGRGASVLGAHCDLLERDGFDTALDRADAALGGFDTVVVSAGLFAPQYALEGEPDLCERVLHADFTATIGFCEAARRRLLERGGGTLCLFSSVAGDRARSPAVLYGAAKAGLSAYAAGLDHRYWRRGLRTVLVKPGFVRTAMTENLPAPPFAGDPERAARDVLRAIDRGRPVVFTPPIWRAVMWGVRALPRQVMRRTSF